MTVKEYLSVSTGNISYRITDYCGHSVKVTEIDELSDNFLNAKVISVDYSIETAGYYECMDIWIEATIEIEEIGDESE